jgi:mRNA interferase HicA
MNRLDLLRHLQKNGCEQIREGANHSWWINTNNNKRSSIPRHREIPKGLVHKICKDLGIPTK